MAQITESCRQNTKFHIPLCHIKIIIGIQQRDSSTFNCLIFSAAMSGGVELEYQMLPSDMTIHHETKLMGRELLETHIIYKWWYIYIGIGAV